MNERLVPRAPAEDGGVVAVPPLADAGRLIALNRARFQECDTAFLGRSCEELRVEARRAVLEAAREYLAGLGEALPESRSGPIIMAGHQPELFHPGVWVKNFALAGLGRANQATTLNLIVDNDTLKNTYLRLPVLTKSADERPRLQNISFDHGSGEATFEERNIEDHGLFDSFADRVRVQMAGWGYEPLLTSFWPHVLRQARDRPNIGECFAAARRLLERRWGAHNLEVPLSAVCRSEPFAWFACHLLAELPRFHAVYNECVRDHRRRHRIRSRNHPVPDLGEEDGWLELPLWGWRAGSLTRGRLFARPGPDRVELRVGTDVWPSIPAPASQPEAAVVAWRQLEAQGLKVRTRALTTTLYARLFLCDLFVHGIGGGKYDELTDAILARFLQRTPPELMILSATLLLPLPTTPNVEDQRREISHTLRDLQYNPQRHLPTGTASDLVREKQGWIERQPTTKVERRERYHAIRRVSAALRPSLGGVEQELMNQLRVVEREVEENAVNRRRDYSFCLYPEEMLRGFCTRFLMGEA